MHHASSPPAHDPYAAFRVPGLWRYLLGATLFQIGTGAQGLAIGLDIWQRTGQPLALGLVGGVQAIPMLLLSLPAGYIADRWDRRKIVALCLCLAACSSLGLAWLSYSQGPIPLMYLLLGLDATLMTMMRPAGASIFPSLVPPKTLENAMKWRTSLNQVSSVTGPALGGLIVVWCLPAAYMVGSLCAFIYAGIALTLALTPPAKPTEGMRLSTVLAGVQFVWDRKLLLATISLDLFAVLLGGATYLLPVFALDTLGGDKVLLGWLRAAPAVGAFCTAILLAHMPPMRNAGKTMLWAVAGFGAATIVFGLSHNVWLSWAMLCITGATDNVSVVVRHTLIQLLTPDHMRGRVSAVNSVFIGSSNEIGGLESGLVAQAFGPTASVVIGGIGTVAVVGLWAALFPMLRRFRSLSTTPETVAGEQPSTKEPSLP